MAGLAWLTPRLPRRLLLAMAHGLGGLASLVDRRGRATALENLRVVLPELSPGQARRVVRLSYANFARSFLDLFWFQRLDQDSWARWVEIEGLDEARRQQLLQSGAVHVTPHFGNFEWASLIWGYLGFHRMHVVAQDFKNPRLTGLFSRLREHSGHRLIPQRGAMLRLMKVLKRRGHVALLTDLNVKPGRSATVIRCFGLPTCVTRLHADLAVRCRVPVAAGVCEPIAGGRYRVRLLEVFDPPAANAGAGTDDQARDIALDELVQRVWQVFEPEIRRRPELWMWMYKHWRYRPDHDPAGFPAYANRSGAFARLLRQRGG